MRFPALPMLLTGMLWFAPDPFPADRGAGTVLHVPAVPGYGFVAAYLYAERGALVRVLRQARFAGDRYLVAWDGNDREGRTVPPGTYLALVHGLRDGVRVENTVPVTVLPADRP